MAKRRGKRRHRTGSIITTRKLNGLGNLKSPSSVTGAVVPPVLGGAIAGGTTLALEHMDTGMVWMPDYAGAIGLGASAAVAAVMWKMVGKPQALALLAAAATVTGLHYGKKYLESVPATRGYRTRNHMGAVVAERLSGRGTGAIVMESNAQQGYNTRSGGEKVKVAGGLGAINSSAFGTSAFES